MTDTQERAAALKPCPFCGGPAQFEQVAGPTVNTRDCSWTVGCANLEADCIGTQMITCFTRKCEAAEAWNTRAAEAEVTRLTARVAELPDECKQDGCQLSDVVAMRAHIDQLRAELTQSRAETAVAHIAGLREAMEICERGDAEDDLTANGAAERIQWRIDAIANTSEQAKALIAVVCKAKFFARYGHHSFCEADDCPDDDDDPQPCDCGHDALVDALKGVTL